MYKGCLKSSDFNMNKAALINKNGGVCLRKVVVDLEVLQGEEAILLCERKKGVY